MWFLFLTDAPVLFGILLGRGFSSRASRSAYVSDDHVNGIRRATIAYSAAAFQTISTNLSRPEVPTLVGREF